MMKLLSQRLNTILDLIFCMRIQNYHITNAVQTISFSSQTAESINKLFFNGRSHEITLTVPLRRFLGLIWTLWTPPQPPYQDLVQRQYSLFINKTNNINSSIILLYSDELAGLGCLELVIRCLQRNLKLQLLVI